MENQLLLVVRNLMFVATLPLICFVSISIADTAPQLAPNGLFYSKSKTDSELSTHQRETDLNERVREVKQTYSGKARVALIKPGNVLNKDYVSLEGLNGTSISIRRVEVKELLTPSTYAWFGYIQSDEFPESRYDELAAEGYPESAISALKRSMLGVKLYVKQWSKNLNNGTVNRSKYIAGQAFTAASDGMIVVEEGDSKYETFYSLQGSIRLPGSKDEIVVSSLDNTAPEFHVIAQKKWESPKNIDNDDYYSQAESDPEGHEQLMKTLSEVNRRYGNGNKAENGEGQQ